MKIKYCKKSKTNYFMLGYFYNFGGAMKISEHFKKAKEIADKHGYDIDDMYDYEVQVSSHSKLTQVMYCKKPDQIPVEGAEIIEDFFQWLKS